MVNFTPLPAYTLLGWERLYCKIRCYTAQKRGDDNIAECYDSASNFPMPEFCDVAVPVPLHMVLTYRLPEGPSPSSGSRVIVPFRRQRLAGVVTELHDRAPKVTAKTVLQVLDEAPALSAAL